MEDLLSVQVEHDDSISDVTGDTGFTDNDSAFIEYRDIFLRNNNRIEVHDDEDKSEDDDITKSDDDDITEYEKSEDEYDQSSVESDD